MNADFQNDSLEGKMKKIRDDDSPVSLLYTISRRFEENENEG